MVNQLIHDLCSLEQVEALALGGSHAGEQYDDASDFDVYLYYTSPISEDVRQNILVKYCNIAEIGNHFWEQEDNCQLKNGVDIDILYRNLDNFICEVASVVEGFHPSNSYSTCMWHNLLTCKILYDRNDRLASAKDRFNIPYPSELKHNIMQRSLLLLHGSLASYDKQIAKAVKRQDFVSINHRVTAFLETYFDFLFALNEQTHPGEKRLIQLCIERCNLLPPHFEENLSRLFKDLYQNPNQIPLDIDAILSELKLLP